MENALKVAVQKAIGLTLSGDIAMLILTGNALEL